MADRQGRDESGTPTPLEWPASWAELGSLLRQIREPAGLRPTAKLLAVSKSTLERYELGAHPLPVDIAKLVDQTFALDGWCEAAATRLAAPGWRPRLDEFPGLVHQHRWEPSFAGTVWVLLRPTEISRTREVECVFRWGPWRAVAAMTVPDAGVYGFTGKAADGGAAPGCTLTTSLPIHAYWGAGVPPEGEKLDLRHRWVRA